MKLVIFGCGYSARRFVALHGGGFERIAATSRNPESLVALSVSSPAGSAGPREGDPKASTKLDLPGSLPLADAGPGTTHSATGRRENFLPLAFDGAELSQALHGELAHATHLLVSIPPPEGGDVVLPLLRSAATPALRWVGYLSTVGVYGDAGGGWVDEASPLRADGARNIRRVEAERDWAGFAESRAVALQIFRIAGIYGPGRSALDALRKGTARRIVKPGQVFNRIHVDDIAGAIAAGMARPHLTGPVNLADDAPAPPQDVVAFAAELLDIAPPPEVALEEAGLGEMGRSFYAANKRVSNRRLHEALGYALAYPTYREGLAALLSQMH